MTGCADDSTNGAYGMNDCTLDITGCVDHMTGITFDMSDGVYGMTDDASHKTGGASIETARVYAVKCTQSS